MLNAARLSKTYARSHPLSLAGLLLLALSACNQESFEDILGDVDAQPTPTPTSSGSPLACTIDSSLPSGATVRVASSAGTNTSFGIARSSSTCAITWKLNGVTISGQTDPFTLINSTSFLAGANTLVAEITDGSTSASRTWTVTKNSAPTCNTQNPSASGNTMAHTATLALGVSVSDADADAQSFTWKLNGAQAPTLFTGLSSTTNTANATFDPTVAQVGAGQTLSVDFNDGYETASCSWAVDITDPNTVQISNCLPSGNPVVVKSTGADSSKTFSVAATGTGLTYVWKLNGSTVGGASSADLTLTAAGLSVGNHTLVAEVTDAYSNQASCTYNVKRNAPPVLSAPTPDTGITRRVNFATTQTFGVTGSDANNDAITYVWKLDGSTNAALPTGSATSIFNPASSLALLGAHTVTVTASDTYEEVTTTWNIEVNQFSDECNTVMNGTLASHGGKICTLVGIPGIGDLEDPSNGNLGVRIQPHYAIDDGSGNVYFSDVLSNIVGLYNRSGSTLVRHGKSIPAGKIGIVVGNGAPGAVPEGSVTGAEYKLSGPRGLAYDSANTTLYIADYGNNRVVKLPDSGIATTVLGQKPNVSNPGNNAAGNTNGTSGLSHHCNNPPDVAFYDGGGGNRWLYVSCYSSHAIKRLNPDNGLAYVVVGAVGAATAAGNANGLTLDGSSTANGPWGIDVDLSGNIYWSDRGTRRIRMATTGGSSIALDALGALPTTVQITGSGGLTTADLTALQRYQGGAANKWVIKGPASAGQNICVPYRAVVTSAGNLVTKLGSAVTLTLTDPGAGVATGEFYSDDTCSTTTTGANLDAGDTGYTFYYKQTHATNATTLTAAGTLTSGTLAFTPVAAPAVATKWALYLMGSNPNVTCQPLHVMMLNGANQLAAHGSNQTITLSATASVGDADAGAFYTDAGCTSSTTTALFTAGQRAKILYYKATNTQVPANSVRWIFGSGADALAMANSGTTSGFPEATAASFRDALGVSVYQPSGQLRGLFVSSWNNHAVGFVNLHPTATYTFGGSTVGPGNAALVAGTGSGGYNGDTTGNVALINGPYDVAVSADQSFLLIPDYNNLRLRKLDLSVGSGELTNFVGGGRSRVSVLTDAAVKATEAYLNTPGELLFDATNKYLYISDTGNGRIRTVNMRTGQFYTVAGKGTTQNPTVQNDDPLNVWMRGPRGMTFATSGTETFLVYADNQATAGANTTSLIRAFNLSATGGTLLGANIDAGRVSTIVGDVPTGSGAWNSNTNLSSGSSPFANLFYPHSVVSDGTSFYIANYADHSIMRANVATGVTRFIGSGTAGATDSPAVLRNPTALARDPAFPNDANFFFIDNFDQGSGRLRYANFTGSPVAMWSLPGAGVAAGSVNSPTIRTLMSFSIPAISEMNGSNAYLMALAAFDTQVCISSGRAAGGSFGVEGTHSVICYNRADGSVSRRVGPNEQNNPIRGGSPMGREQENIASTSATLFAPYGLAFDGDGNLYISERNSSLVRFVKRWW